MMDTSPAAGAADIAPLLLRNLLVGSFFSAKYSIHRICGLFHQIHMLLISSFLFFLGTLPDIFTSAALFLETYILNTKHPPPPKSTADQYPTPASSSYGGESAIGRVLSLLLVIVTDIPVASRKYGFVQSLAELLIDDNHRGGFEGLREVNRGVLEAAFGRTLVQLEAAAAETAAAGQGPERGVLGLSSTLGIGVGDFYLGRACLVALRVLGAVWAWFQGTAARCQYSAEKLAAELLWLAQKMAACGAVEEAVKRWAAASSLASIGMSAEPRLQGCLVKLSAFLIKQASKGMEAEFGSNRAAEQRRSKASMLVSWVPFLCGASNGTDTPVLSCVERVELERALEEIIYTLSQEEQERVLALWLHHFTRCANSDFPNLRPALLRWCAASRKLAILNANA